MPDLEKALKLKTEGNALFAKKKFLQAFDKYTAAIQEDEENAVLYANRAACSASMGKQLAAESDAKKSVELDPTYVKGWALASWDDCVRSWKSAIAALPPSDPHSPTAEADEKTRKQYEEKLVTALERQNIAQKFSPVVVPAAVNRAGKMPWDKAKDMEPELILMGKEGLNSSAWAAMKAYSDLVEGNEKMNGQRPMGPNGLMFGLIGAVECISNAVTTDRQIFHISDKNWVKKYNTQVVFENTMTGGWPYDRPDVVLRDAQNRLAEGKPWDDVKLSLMTTIRGWIMGAFMANGMHHDRDGALKHYGWALDTIRHGKEIWHDVPKSVRGVIFEDTFMRSVQALNLEVSMQQCSDKGDPTDKLENLYALADELYKNAKAAWPNPDKDVYHVDGAGFHIAFNVYPAAEAMAIKGYYHRRMSKKQKLTEAKKHDHLEKAASLYREAASLYPPDDEHSQYHLCYAIDYLQRMNKPLRETLPLLAILRKNNPRML